MFLKKTIHMAKRHFREERFAPLHDNYPTLFLLPSCYEPQTALLWIFLSPLTGLLDSSSLVLYNLSQNQDGKKMQMATFFCLKSKTLHSLQSQSKVSTMSFLPNVIWLLHHLFFMANNSYHYTFSSTPMDLLILNAPNTQSLLGFALYSSSLWEILSRDCF